MSETTERVGKYELSVAFCPPSDDHEARRIEAMTAWLLAQFEAERKNAEQEDAAAA